MNHAGLILAAGASRRMGFPKALLEYRGETFLDRLVRLFAWRCDPVIVVLGAEAERILAGMRRRDEACVAWNPDYERGQISSMQCGLGAVPPGTPGVLFTLVDHPAVREDTVGRLLEGSSHATLRIPRYNGRRGHPVWFSGAMIPEFLGLEAGLTARDVVNRHAAEIEWLDVDDAGVLADIDDPEAYRRLAGEVVA